MSRQTATHDHAQDGGVDLWRWLDIAVIVAIGVIVAIAAEWLVGLMVRERIARGADRYLAKRAAKDEQTAEG